MLRQHVAKNIKMLRSVKAWWREKQMCWHQKVKREMQFWQDAKDVLPIENVWNYMKGGRAMKKLKEAGVKGAVKINGSYKCRQVCQK